MIAQVFSTDTNVSITALGQLNELMKDIEKVRVSYSLLPDSYSVSA